MHGFYFSPEGSGSRHLIGRTGTFLPTIQLFRSEPSVLAKAAYYESSEVGIHSLIRLLLSVL